MKSKPTHHIALVSCSKTKLGRAAPARDLYTSPLFKKSRAWAERYADEWWILSAKYFLRSPGDLTMPYDVTLRDMIPQERRIWTNTMSSWLLKTLGIFHPNAGLFKITILAGKMYYNDGLLNTLDLHGVRHRIPMEGMGIGQRLKWLNTQLTLSEADALTEAQEARWR